MGFKDIISGNWLKADTLTKRTPTLVYIVFLIVIYIYNVFNVQHLYRKVLRLQSEIARLEVTSTTTQSRRVSVTRQTYIIEQVKQRKIPITEPIVPPRTIK